MVAMSFRTPDEAAQLANNTEYGLAASVWSESINLALDIAPKLRAGVVWVNSTNLFDASAGFGGYKESGFGREGGREGALAYTKPGVDQIGKGDRHQTTDQADIGLPLAGGGVDRTAKMYIGGKQARPDGGYSRLVAAPTEPSSAKSGRAIERIFATRSKPPARLRRAGAGRASIIGRRFSTTSPRISTRGRASSPTA